MHSHGHPHGHSQGHRQGHPDRLVLGPLLRYVDATSAAVWVEVAERGDVAVEVAGRRHEAHTFTVHGHHYALVDVGGLEPGGSHPYTVYVAGAQVWPPADSPYPAPRIRTLRTDGPLDLAFGSCRTSAPHDPATNRTHGVDVMRAYAVRMAGTPPESWPSMLLLLGDQVYADETSKRMRRYIRQRRDVDAGPGSEVKGFEEYTHLYWLAWTDPTNRWLLSTLPTAMIFDDHDIRDDWNTSAAWQAAMRSTSWWHDRIVGGLVAYWIYQHIGNLSAAERAADPVWPEVLRVGRDGDAGDVLDGFAHAADRDPMTYRWSFSRDLGGTRLLMLDTRAARWFTDDARMMVDEVEMRWLDSLLTGGHDHLLIGTSLPFLLPMGLHHFEAWNEALTEGAWGDRLREPAEQLRRIVDLEHWAAFQVSFRRVAEAVTDVARGRRGSPPASVCFLAGDVHHSYLAEADLGHRPGQARLLQAVCSPIRNPLPRGVRMVAAAASRGLLWPLGLTAARAAGVPDPPFRWAISEGPWFDNALATFEIDGRRARLRWESAGRAEPTLHTLHSATVS